MKAIDQFRGNIAYVRSLMAVERVLNAQTTSVLDTSDILRAALVMAVSALDQYIHEKVRQEMLETKNRARPMTDAYQRFTVTLKTVDRALLNPRSDDWLDDEIRSRHALRSFQKSDKIKEAVSLISADNLWQRISQKISKDIAAIRTQLDLIVDRRNQIAHEADLDPGNPGAKWPISYTDVQLSVDFIEEIVEAAEGCI
jgi:hypothetical protein